MSRITPAWENYPPDDGADHSVTGAMRRLPGLWSPELADARDVLVYLPPSYAAGRRRYPVLYLHDGQNLFDRATAFAGVEWGVDETLEALAADGLEAIVVGVYHGGETRLAEYNPFPGVWRGRGQAYLRFLIETLKPIIDRDFRTLPDRAHTGILGSSMGGLISLYGFFHHPDSFGVCGALSPSLWVGGGAIYFAVERAPFVPGRIYLDNGTREQSAQQMAQLLQARGYRPELDLRYVVEKGGEHTEAAWARRLPAALRFLLAPLAG